MLQILKILLLQLITKLKNFFVSKFHTFYRILLEVLHIKCEKWKFLKNLFATIGAVLVKRIKLYIAKCIIFLKSNYVIFLHQWI